MLRDENDQMFKTESRVNSFRSMSAIRSKKASGRIVTYPAGLNSRAVVELDICRPVLTARAIDLWEKALC